MADVSVTISAVNQASGPIKAVSSDLKGLEGAGKSVGGSLSDAGGKLSAFGALAGGALAAGVGLAVKSAADLQKAVANISTIKPDIDTSKVTSSIQQMSTRVAQSSSQLADSLYNIFSSIEVSQEGALALTEKFGRGAVAAQTDAETFGTSVLGVMNAYKLSVSDADHISDVFFNTVNKGVITGDELAHNLGNVSQSAKNAGVDFDTLGALIAGVTKEGGSAATNVNNLNNVLQKIVTADVQNGLKEMGIQTQNADGSFRNVVDTLTDLKAKLDELPQGERAQALQKLFPDNQARTGITTLLSQLGTVKEVVNDNANAVGVANKAYETMGATASAQATILKNTIMAAVTQFGTEALPSLIGVGQQLGKLAQAFSDLSPHTKGLIITGVEVAAAFLLIGSAGIKVVSTAVEIAGALKTVVGVMQATTVAGTSLTTVMGGVGVALLSAEVATRMLTGGREGIVSVTTSLLKYGDALHQGREEATGFFKAHNQDADLGVFDAKIVTLRTHLADLADESAKFSGPSWAALVDLFTGQTTGRNLDANNTQKQIDDLTNYVAKLRETADAEARIAADRATRQRSGLTDFIGPVVPITGPIVPPGAVEEANKLAAAMAAVAISIDASAQAARADDFAHYSGAISDARTIAVSLAEAQQALAERFAAQSAALQGVTTTVGPLQGALDLLNQKVAAGIPLSSEQQHLLSTLPGYIAGASSGYDGLVTNLAQTTIAQLNANRAAGEAGGAFGGMGGQASTLQGTLDKLRASTIAVESAFGALGQENSKLAGYYSLLEERSDALQQKQKEGGVLTANETAELATLRAALAKIGDARGLNAAQMRDYVFGLLGLGDATKVATGQLNDFGAALGTNNVPEGAQNLVGLTDGFGNVATSSVNAKKKVDDVTAAVNAAPKTMVLTVSAPGANEAALAVQNVGTQVNNIPKSFTITAYVNTGAAKIAIQELSDMIPRSPARTGPFRKLPDWKAIYEGLTPAGAGAVAAVTNTTAAMAGALKAGVDEAAKTAADIASSVAKAVTDVIGAGGALAKVNPNGGPSGAQFAWLTATTTALVQSMQSAAANFKSEGLKAAGDLSDTAGKVGGSVKNTLEGLAALAQAKWADISPSSSALGWYTHLMVSLVQNFVAASAQFETEGLDGAGKLGETAGKVGGSVKASLEGLAGLASAKWADISPSGSAMAWFTHLMASLAQNFAEAAKQFETEGLDAAGKLAETSSKIGGSIGPTIAGLRAIAAGFPAPSPQSVDRLVEAIRYWVRRFGEVAATMSTEGVKHLGDFSDATSKALKSGSDGIALFKSFDDKLVIPSAKKIDDLYFGIQHFVDRFREMALSMSTEGVAALATYADAVGKSLGSAKTASDLFKDMEKQVLPTTAAVDALLGAMGYVIQQTRAVAVAVGTEGMTQALTFASDAQAFFSSIKGTLDLFPKLADDKDKPAKALHEVWVSLEDALAEAGALSARADAMKQEGLSFLAAATAAQQAFDKGLQILGSIGKSGAQSAALFVPQAPGVSGGTYTVPGRAAGGPVAAGQMYMVGENGPEYFLPRQSGTIVPNGAGFGGGGGGGNMYISINVAGSVISEGQLVDKVRAGLLQKGRTVPTLGFN